MVAVLSDVPESLSNVNLFVLLVILIAAESEVPLKLVKSSEEELKDDKSSHKEGESIEEPNARVEDGWI